MKQERREACRLSSFLLRLLALLAMVVDHTGLALFPGVSAFRCAGRLAFPLYCFLLAQGYAHTRDLRAYARRLLLMACLSEIPFDLLIFGRVASGVEQNVLFSLLLALMAMLADDTLADRPLWSALAVASIALMAMLARVSYGWLGVALCVWLNRTRDSRARQALGLCVIEGVYALSLLLSGVDRGWVGVSLCAMGAAVPVLLYNGKRGLRNPVLTFLFYAAYPAHLMGLVLVRQLRLIPPYFLG